jgi:hypothetical protein
MFLVHTKSYKTRLRARVYPVGNEWPARRIGPLSVQQTQETNIPATSAGLEPAIPVIKWPQLYALDRTATRTGSALFNDAF